MACLPVPPTSKKRSGVGSLPKEDTPQFIGPRSTPSLQANTGGPLTVESFATAEEYISFVVREAREVLPDNSSITMKEEVKGAISSSSSSSSSTTTTIANSSSPTKTSTGAKRKPKIASYMAHLSLSSLSSCPKCNLPPTMEWRVSVRTDFEELSRYFSEIHISGVVKKLKPNKENDFVGGDGDNTQSDVFPPMKDREGWKSYCLSYNWQGEPARLPSATILLRMDQVMVRKVLSHMISYIPNKYNEINNADGDDGNMDESDSEDESESRGSIPLSNLTRLHSTWIYSLAARLDTPLHSDTQSVLRGGLRKLCKIRSGIDINAVRDRSGGGEEQFIILPMINTLIEIFGSVFGQGGEREIYPK